VQVIHFPRGSGATPFTGASIAEATQPCSLAVLTAGSRHRFRAQQDRLTCCEPAFGWGVSLAHPSGRPSPRRLQWEQRGGAGLGEPLHPAEGDGWALGSCTPSWAVVGPAVGCAQHPCQQHRVRPGSWCCRQPGPRLSS